MNPDPSTPSPGWDEQNSQDFLGYGRDFVPERERQVRTLVSLLPAPEPAGAALDVCGGEALLAEAILESRPGWNVYELDGSPEMLRRAWSTGALRSTQTGPPRRRGENGDS